MRKKRFLATLGIAAALAAGGATAVVLGGPGVSGAQTSDSTTPPTTQPTTPPSTDQAPNATRHNCPNMGSGSSPGAPSSGTSATGFRSRGTFQPV